MSVTKFSSRRKFNYLALRNRLDKHICGQEEAKSKIASALWWNMKRALFIKGGVPAYMLPQKANVLLTGPSGCGKTLIANATAEILEVPFASVSATSFSGAGYAGQNVDDIPLRLAKIAGGNVGLAQRGIVFIDEFDKLKERDFDGRDDVSCMTVQKALLGLVEGTTDVFIDDKRFDLTQTTFVAAGVFSGIDDAVQKRLDQRVEDVYPAITADDIIQYGFLAELIGRFQIAKLTPLDNDALRKLIASGESSPLNRFVKLFALHGLDLEFYPDGIDALVETVVGSPTGVRALNDLLWTCLQPIITSFADLHQSGIVRVGIDRRTIEGESEPWLHPGETRVQVLEELKDILERGAALFAAENQATSPEELAKSIAHFKKAIGVDKADPDTQSFWRKLEAEYADEGNLRLFEELLRNLDGRNATAKEFADLKQETKTHNLRGVVHLLDYQRYVNYDDTVAKGLPLRLP